MKFDFNKTIDAIQDGIRIGAEELHNEVKDFHKNYASKIIPDFGKYGDVAKFSAELVPGVSEYNAIKEGNWKEFAIAAGVDITAIGIGVVTGGTGFAAVKGGSVAAKAGVKAATRELVGAGTRKVIKEATEEGSKKLAKEAVETGTQKAIKETAEQGSGKTVKEVAEDGVQKGTRISESPRNIITRNEGLEGSVHPITGVQFERKIVTLPNGEKIEGVFAKFESTFDARIPEEMFNASDKTQFRECSKQLCEAFDLNPELKSKFTKEQIEQIREGVLDGSAPEGFVWHHDAEAGKLQLVEKYKHDHTGHTGGRAVWGGGSANR